MNEVAVTAAEFLIKLLAVYLTAGFVFAMPFLLFGIQRVDPTAQWENLLSKAAFWRLLLGGVVPLAIVLLVLFGLQQFNSQILMTLFGTGKLKLQAVGIGSGIWLLINTIGFRIVILPGLAVFWPLFAVRWVRGQGKPQERNAHRRLAKQN
jgi:hypothetical protein